MNAKRVRMSPLGQNPKNSMRASVFRFAPESGRRQDTSAGPFRANMRHRGYKLSQEKAARRRLFNSTLMIVDQAGINSGFDFRQVKRSRLSSPQRSLIYSWPPQNFQPA